MTRSLIQVWASEIGESLSDEVHQRDLHRAQLLWQGEDRMWLLPDQQAVSRIVTGSEPLPRSECRLPAEQLDVLDVHNIDERGRTFPPLHLPKTGGRIPDGFYKYWLNVEPYLLRTSPQIKLRPPGSDSPMDLQFEAKVSLPFVEAAEHSVVAAWPPPGVASFGTVSPEGENKSLGSPGNSAKSLQFWLAWPEPFNRLFPLGGGADVIFHHTLMRRLAELIGSGQRTEALVEAQAWTGRLVGEAFVSIERAVLAPALGHLAYGFDGRANPEATETRAGLLIDLAERFGIEARTVEELFTSVQLRQAVERPVPVQRVQGWLGYFWLEFYKDLRDAIAIRLCSHCGNVLHGGHWDRKLCSKTENPDCYRQRNAASQRRRRAITRHND